LRADVLGLLEASGGLDGARRDVEDRQPQVAGHQRLQVGRESVGAEGQRLAVGRPGRIELRELIRGQPFSWPLVRS
jgi:hypothetical protein